MGCPRLCIFELVHHAFFFYFRREISKIGRIAVSTISGEFDDFVPPLSLEVAADMLAGIGG